MEHVRTCLVCRKKAEKVALCRFVRAHDGEICFDEKAVLPHRGAWLCPDKHCFAKAFSKKLLFKGEKTLPTDYEAMISFVKSRLKKSALDKLGLLKRCGQIEMGKDAVKRMVKEQRACAVVFAKDFSERSLKDFEKEMAVQDEQRLWVKSSLAMEQVGQCLGRKETGVVGLLQSRITDEILLQLNKLKELEL